MHVLKRSGAGLTALCLTAVTLAEPHIPAADSVVAEWSKTQSEALRNTPTPRQQQLQDPQAIAALANAYLDEASQPGQARLYGLAEAALKPLVTKAVNDPDVWLAWAQVQQHQHAFDDALAALDRVLQQNPTHTTANLIAARIHLIQGNTAAARTDCLKLLGHADLLTVSACSLEVASYHEKLEASYEQLTQLISRQGIPSDTRGPWLLQMLADMAMRLGQPAEAIHWLDQRLATSNVNYLAQWADAQLAAHQPQQVINHLKPIVENAPAIDDALLLRMAQAEQQLGGKHWQTQLAARVALREQRQDTQHASELARYYLDIDPQPEKALYWARLNWQTAREYADEKLLQQAQQMAEPSSIKHNSTKNSKEG